MKTRKLNLKTPSVLLWFVIVATAFSFCGAANPGHEPAHPGDAPDVSRCMLKTCDTLTSKNLSAPGGSTGFAALLSFLLIPLSVPLYRTWLSFPASFFRAKDPRLENPPRLYQLCAVLII